ncbi:MAG TPA: diaminopimelate epimerase [Polyangiaceae bacterium]|jgi:diaminopimelate epimerase|nr:diaminopimelate epimerase [Polyangiaceae bacterium]
MTEPTTLRFTKYEGLGNDFLIVDALDDSLLDAGQVERLCDRHFGVGADGVLLVTSPKSLGARATMVVLNADGSRPEMCGNGLRCVALHLALQDRATAVSFIVDTDGGPKLVAVERTEQRGSVSVGMGRGLPEGELSYAFHRQSLAFERISMGNPHAVSFDTGLDERALDELGPALSGQFPGGSNVELVTKRDARALDVIVWERGVGRTLACGTGACAVVVAAARQGRVAFDTEVEVGLPGGPLHISVSRETLEVTMRGPAKRVFSGEVRLR